MRTSAVLLLAFASVPCFAQIKGVTVLHDLFNGGGPSDTSFVTGISDGQQVGSYSFWNPKGTFPGVAVKWEGTVESRVDMTPPGYSHGRVIATSFGTQAGWVNVSSAITHAFLWHSSPHDTLNLHVNSIGKTSFDLTGINSISGNEQVGFGGNVTGTRRAVKWQGSAMSAELLHPEHLGFTRSQAMGTDGKQQVGIGRTGGGEDRALLWSGTAASALDLTPKGASSAEANGVAGGYQVGSIFLAGTRRASVWQGSSASWVDLHPEGAFGSRIYATNGVWHVGSVSRSAGPGRLDDEHAVMWNAATHEMIDLHDFVSPLFQTSPSRALCIDELGNVGGYITSTSTSVYGPRAAMWVVPEPGTFVALGGGILLLALRFRKS